ncbi:alpha/beta hydrolase [Allokutzneria sp. A3M-2-11 16]|uniref:alpha/beta fold hydrolase n=1 Tax=Allokutzneria sp. A3M-2-11 16 TaxID=2962043 RepID=UPI0020B8B44C|nr:alpha/beta hydrolase [Allokutzneria sp. A3M-2-11 16]MCP3801665.1 alpha/beta hydrolase [Allokutzneria sp. A3M-2-11 16]
MSTVDTNWDAREEKRDQRSERVIAEFRQRPSVRRLSRPMIEGGSRRFELTYVREGSRGATPLLVLPGGPGLASVLPYHRHRTLAARREFDVVMVEHRGIGLSRHDELGHDLPFGALTVDAAADDLAAVLDDCDIERAVVLGSSYGAYLAQTFGAKHPERVAGMVLDSTYSTVSDFAVARDEVRRLLWHGRDAATAGIAAKLRELVGSGVIPAEETGSVIPVFYELGGPALVDRLLDAVAAGRWGPWRWMHRVADEELGKPSRYVLELDLVSAMNYRELYDLEPDGLPLDQAVAFAKHAKGFPAFEGEPRCLLSALEDFDWPTAVLTAERDLRTVRPVAERTARLLPDGALVPFRDMPHSVLDNHPVAALNAARGVALGQHHRLPAMAPKLAALPSGSARSLLGLGLRTWLTVARP